MRLSKHPDDERPTPLPGAERTDQMKKLQASLTGISLTGELEPSHALIAKYHAMSESGDLRALPWEELTWRDIEVRNGKKDDFLKPDRLGGIRVVSQVTEPRADIGSDLLLQHAFTRRGVAMHLSRLLDFKVHQKYVGFLMKHYMRVYGWSCQSDHQPD